MVIINYVNFRYSILRQYSDFLNERHHLQCRYNNQHQVTMGHYQHYRYKYKKVFLWLLFSIFFLFPSFGQRKKKIKQAIAIKLKNVSCYCHFLFL